MSTNDTDAIQLVASVCFGIVVALWLMLPEGSRLWPMVAILATVGVVAVGVVAVALPRARTTAGRLAPWNRTLTRIGADLGLRARRGIDPATGGAASPALLVGTLDGQPVRYAVEAPDDPDAPVHVTCEVEVDLPIPPGMRFDVRDQRIAPPIDTGTGDPEFDAAILVSGPPLSVVGWLDADRRAWVHRTLTACDATIRDRRVRFDRTNLRPFRGAERDRIQALVDLARALVARPEATRDRLVDRAMRDPIPGVRRRALEVLAAHRPLEPDAARRLEHLARGPEDAGDEPAAVALAAAMLFDRRETVAAWAHVRGAETDLERRDLDRRVARAIRWLTEHDPEGALRAAHDAFARPTGEASALASVHAFATIGGGSARGGLVRAAFAASDAVGAALLHTTTDHDDADLVREVHTTLARYANPRPALAAIERCRVEGALRDVAWLREVAADRNRPREVRAEAERAAHALQDTWGHDGRGGALALHDEDDTGGALSLSEPEDATTTRRD